MRHLSQIIEEREMEEETVYLVLDRAERLRNQEPTLLPALLRLAELVSGWAIMSCKYFYFHYFTSVFNDNKINWQIRNNTEV